MLGAAQQSCSGGVIFVSLVGGCFCSQLPEFVFHRKSCTLHRGDLGFFSLPTIVLPFGGDIRFGFAGRMSLSAEDSKTVSAAGMLFFLSENDSVV